MKRFAIALIVALVAAGALLYAGAQGWLGRAPAAGQPTPPVPHTASEAGTPIDAGPAAGRQILFGDLHVHTIYSTDANLMSLPMMQGDGPHPPADACDFARYCSRLDFWSINDHAEGLTPPRWESTREAIRQCNALADPANPDLVSFLGYEWTQMSQLDAANHFGHKNVIFRDTAEGRVPLRPIASRSRLMAVTFWQASCSCLTLSSTGSPAGNAPLMSA